MKDRGTTRIHTRRLVLRPFTMADVEPVFRNWASDPEVTRFLTWKTHENPEVTRMVVEQWVKGNENPENYQWAVELMETGEPVGSISAVKMDRRTESATVGYCLGSRFWGQGIMAEALEAVIAFFFREVGLNCVNACHDPRNPNSGRVMQKCGMTCEGTWRAAGINNQGVCDEVWYSILRREYQSGRSDSSVWNELYQRALAVRHGRIISKYVEAGGVAAAIQSASGRIYTGICVDSCSGLGICAERNAIFNMLTNGEHTVTKVLAVMPDGHTGAPCGACRELMVQLMPDSCRDIEIMLDYEKGRIVTLGALTPEWWI